MPGVDLGSFEDEYMDVSVEGSSFGRWECGVANSGGSLIPGASGDPSDCLFSLDLAILGADLTAFLSDGIFSVDIQLGSGVGYFSGERDTLTVQLEYTEGVSEVPLPAGLPLLLGGVGLLGWMRRRNG